MKGTPVRLFISSLLACVALSTAANAQDASARLLHLHNDLHISGDQEDVWRRYADLAGQGAEMQSRHQATQALLAQLPTPRRLALLEATMTQDLADFHRQSVAVMALYSRLSPDQQRIFDKETLPRSNEDAASSSDDQAPPIRTLQMPPP